MKRPLRIGLLVSQALLATGLLFVAAFFAGIGSYAWWMPVASLAFLITGDGLFLVFLVLAAAGIVRMRRSETAETGRPKAGIAGSVALSVACLLLGGGFLGSYVALSALTEAVAAAHEPTGEGAEAKRANARRQNALSVVLVLLQMALVYFLLRSLAIGDM